MVWDEKQYIPGSRKITVEETLIILNAIADGLNWEDFYSNSLSCIYAYINLTNRIDEAGFNLFV